MMRSEIFFRGQTRRKGQKVWMDGSPVEGNWVYGGVCHGTGDFSLIYGNLDEERERPTEKWVVYTDTVGQFTGLTDKNGKRAFEHDVIKHHFGNEIGVIRYGEYRNPFGDDIHGGHVGFYVDWVSGKAPELLRKDLAYWMKLVEILGNIHDNPELLGGVEDG